MNTRFGYPNVPGPSSTPGTGAGERVPPASALGWGTALNPQWGLTPGGPWSILPPAPGGGVGMGERYLAKLSLPTPSHLELGALVVLGTESRRRSRVCSLFPLSRREQSPGAGGEKQRGQRGRHPTAPPGEALGRGQPETKRYPASEHPPSASRGHAGHGHGGVERPPPPAPQNHPSVLATPPPIPSLCGRAGPGAMLSAGGGDRPAGCCPCVSPPPRSFPASERRDPGVGEAAEP